MSGTNSGKSRSRIHWPKRSELLHLPDVVPHVDVHVVLGRPGTGHRVAQRGWERAGPDYLTRPLRIIHRESPMIASPTISAVW
jgi:hypothetical protein